LGGSLRGGRDGKPSVGIGTDCGLTGVRFDPQDGVPQGIPRRVRNDVAVDRSRTSWRGWLVASELLRLCAGKESNEPARCRDTNKPLRSSDRTGVLWRDYLVKRRIAGHVTMLLWRELGSDYVVAEIKDGRLPAVIRPGHTRGRPRNMYRVAPAALESYIKKSKWRPQTTAAL
jgi:hypothetical protein